jgi:hypothetical protein
MPRDTIYDIARFLAFGSIAAQVVVLTLRLAGLLSLSSGTLDAVILFVVGISAGFVATYLRPR